MSRSPWQDAGAEEGLPELLWDDGERTFCKVWRNGTDDVPQPFIVALLSAEHPSPSATSRLVHEHELKDYIDGAWALRPRELVRERGKTSLVLDYQDVRPLDASIGSPMETGHFLQLAVALTGSLAGLHERGLVHKDIRPVNILTNATSDKVWLTGFGIATRVRRERQPPDPPEFIAGTLSHMAPEQTGRMNRSIDARSDLYSLGVTLYQALTGGLPFTATDPMEWVHCHIARRPTPPHLRVPRLSTQLSAIVVRLLAKTPEERYQTAAGVEHDLRRCLTDWENRYRIDEFVLGEGDIPDRLLMPEQLYGREREIEALLTAFDEVIERGSPGLVLVCGSPGIGKSSVVNELHKVLVPPRGLFASGKFEQLQRDVPYATLTQAFQTLIRRLLAKPEAELSTWRENLRQALDPHGALVTELIPELKFVIGEQPPAPEVPAAVAKARLQQALQRMLGVFARPEHPLALFFDDLQWLDTATLDLLEDLVAQPDLRHLLLVGAYRDNEVDSAHPLMRRLAAMQQAGGKLRTIVLGPLNEADLARLLAGALHCEPQRALPLARLVHDKTAGNPFFVNHFIHALADEGLVTFDVNRACWSWDISSIQAKGYTENVVDLMAGKLRRLPQAVQNALSDLACLGNTAQTSMLAIAHELPADEVHAVLWQPLCTELIARSESSYRFAHDRIQEAAYSLIQEQARAQSHLRIGRQLAAQFSGDRRDEAVFDIVGQLNRGSSLIVSRAEQEEVAALNLMAARRAKAAAAYASALNYLVAGTALVAPDWWHSRRVLCFQLELQRAECEFLTGEFGIAAERIEALRCHAIDTVERALVACLSIDVYTALGQSDRAIGVCLEYMKHLAIEWPLQPTEADARREYELIWSQVKSLPIRDLVDRPLMTDPESLATLDVLAKAVAPALFTAANLLSLVICRIVNISLEHGNSDASCFGYVWLGLIAGPRFGNYQAAFQFGRLGHELVETRGLSRFQAATNMCFAHGVMPWTEDFRACCDMLRRTFAAAYRSGDLNYAAYSCNALITELLAAGEELSAVQHEAEHGLAFAGRARFGLVTDVIAAQLALIRNLRGLAPSFGCFDDGQFEERRFEQHLAGDPNLALPECWYWIRKLQARFFAGDYAAAVDAASRAQALLWTTLSMLEVADYHFFAALARAAVCDLEPPERRHVHLQALTADYAQHLIWAQNGPGNFETRAALVAAEIARLEGRTLDAETLYETAIRAAHASGFVHNEALACELTARFYAARGFDRIARAYMRDARLGYLQWGADGKARQLETLHPYLRDDGPRSDPRAVIHAPVERLELAAVLEVLHTVSGESDLERTITTIVRLALEHAGAERGFLILPTRDTLWIEAEALVSNDVVRVDLRQSAITAESMPESVLQYALRTSEAVLLHDASAEHPFCDDAYVGLHRSRSVLCMPLMKQARMVGLIYLENSLASGVFTPARMATLKLLASEAAISLENRRLYRALEERESRVRRLVDSNIIGIIIWHTDGRVLDANEAFLRIIGYEREDLISGRVHWTGLTPEEWREGDSAALEDLKRGGVIHSREREYIRKDGTRVPVLVGGAMFDGAPDEGVAFVLDLSERKRAEEALRESERQSRMIVDGIPGMVALLSATGELEVVNRQLLEYFGQTLEELKHWGTTDTVHREDLPHVIDVFGRAIEVGIPYQITQRFRRSDGSYRWFTNRGFPLRDAGAGVVRWCVLLADIDELKRAEDALRASERNLKLIIDTIPALAWSARPDGNADFFNQHFLDYLGFSAAEAANWGWAAAVHPEDINNLLAAWQRITASKAPGEAEARLRRDDGTYRWFLFRVNPLRDAQGSILEWYGINTDIEDRKLAEAELRRAYNSFADAQRLSQTGSFITDLVGDDHNWSEEAFRIFGFEPTSKVSVQRIRDMIHPSDVQAFESTIAQGMNGENVSFAFRITTDRGAQKHVRGVAHVVEQVQGRPMFVGALQDVTDGKVAEEKLIRARDELAHVARVASLSTLTASIAHEVNQPLSGIVTNAATSLRMLDAEPPDIVGARATARRTIRDAHRAAEVVTRLRALYSKKEFALEPLDLNEATRELIALSWSELQRNGVILESELAAGLPLITGDRVQLQQVILNLLRNASEAMRDVHDRPRKVMLRTEREDEDGARVTVRDAGTGFALGDMEHLFEAFYTTKRDGMGIGLSVSRSIIERHRGRLWAEANDGPGATFSFCIPGGADNVPSLPPA